MPTLTVGNKSNTTGYVAALGTLTLSHTVAAGSNRILLVGTVTEEQGETPQITGVTYNGVAMTAVTNSEQAIGGVTWVRGQWWYLINPATGANNVVATIGTAGEDANLGLYCADYSNHNGSAPVGNFKASSASANTLNTGSIAYTDGDVIAALEADESSGNTITWTNATEYTDATIGTAHASTAFATQTGSGNVTITSANSATERMALTAVRISPVAATPTIETVGTLTPGATVPVTYSGYAAVPLTANSTLGGVGITVSNATLSGCDITVPADSAFQFGGSLAALNFNTNTTLVLANGSETDSHTVQVAPASSDQYAQRSAAALEDATNYPLDSYNGGLTCTTGDWVYQYSSPLDSFTPNPEINGMTPLEPAFDLLSKYYDVSASSWSGLTTKPFPPAAPPGGGTLEISGTQVSIKPPGTIVPGSYSLTAYGDIDWVKTARVAASQFDTKSGASVIGAPSNIGVPAWTRNEYGDATSDALLTWTDGAELASYPGGDRNVEYTTVVGAGKRWVISPAGALRKLYLFAGTYQGVARIDVSFSDSSAGPVTYELSSASGIYETELVEILAQPAGGAATITVDLTLVSGFSVGWAALAVGSGTPAAVYSLTSADTTVTPGQVVRQTLVGGPFAGAVTAAYAVIDEYQIPLSWTVISPTLTDLTMPALSEFFGGQDAERLRMYTNFVLRIEAGSESAETAITNQIVPPNSGDFGIVAAPPWGGDSPPNAQQNDECYGELVDGAGVFTPETFDFAETVPSIIRWHVFNLATEKWLPQDDVYIGYAGKSSDLYIRAVRIRSFRRLANSYKPSRLRPFKL
jgi:hypothetical protein